MQKKFQPNDKIFYIIDDDEDCEPINVCYVISEEEASKIYSKMGKTKPSVETCTARSAIDYGCLPVFIVDELGSESIGWMPENQLYLYTDIVKVLFGRKDR